MDLQEKIEAIRWPIRKILETVNDALSPSPQQKKLKKVEPTEAYWQNPKDSRFFFKINQEHQIWLKYKNMFSAIHGIHFLKVKITSLYKLKTLPYYQVFLINVWSFFM